MNKILLLFIKVFKPLLGKSKIEFAQIEAIIETKLLIDKRRVRSFNNYSSDKKSYSDYLAIFIYFMIGLMMTLMLLIFKQIHVGLSIYFTVFIFYIVFTLISDFSEVLFDVRDNYLILPTPISAQTLIYAKLLHLIIFLIKLYLPYLIPAIIFMGIKFGVIGVLLFIFQSFLCLIMSTLVVKISYLAFFKLFDPSGFKDLINYFQIAITILMLSAYYVGSTIFETIDAVDFNLADNWFSALSPGVWIAGLSRWLIDGIVDHYTFITCGLAIIIPSICFVLISRIFTKGYLNKLMLLNVSNKVKEVEFRKNEKTTLGKKLSKFFKWDNYELAGFEFSLAITGRNRTFKQRTYPLFGFIPAYLFYFMMDNEDFETLSEKFTGIQESRYDIMIGYAILYLFALPLFHTRFSNQHKNAEIFKALPIKKPGKFIRGNLNAIIFKFGIPSVIISSIAIFWIWDWSRWPTIITLIINGFITAVIINVWSLKTFPFSDSWENYSKGSNSVLTIFMMLILGILGLIHYFLFLKFPYVHMGYCIVILGLAIFLYRMIGQWKWKDLRAKLTY